MKGWHFAGAGSVPGWVHVLGSPLVHGLMSAAALLGPGREVLALGLRAAAAGCPDMNTLVGLGAGAAFGVSCVAAALPALGWRTFFEEPAMLLGVVLLGRTLERRAKLQASADMTALRVRAWPVDCSPALTAPQKYELVTAACPPFPLAPVWCDGVFIS